MVSFLCPTTAQWLCIAAVLGFGYQPALNRMGKDCFFGVYGSGRDFKLTPLPIHLSCRTPERPENGQPALSVTLWQL